MPPLNAMKAFEVVARLGSFARAARELGVSSAAVSQHVRNLEAFFGKELFTRTGNRLAMTDAAHAIYGQTAEALSALAGVASRLREGEARPRFVVSVPFSLVEPWLLPRLALLVARHPRIAVDVRVEDDPLDLERFGIDLRVSYGGHHYPGRQSVPLFHDAVVPVCAPGFLARVGSDGRTLDGMHESAFIHTNWGPSYASHPTWAEWFAHAGSAFRPDPARGRRVGLSSLALAAARAGLGVALAQRALAGTELEAGRLVALAGEGLQLGHPYHAFPTPSRAKIREINELLALMGEEGVSA